MQKLTSKATIARAARPKFQFGLALDDKSGSFIERIPNCVVGTW